MDRFSEDKQKGDLLLQKALAFFLGQEGVPTASGRITQLSTTTA